MPTPRSRFAPAVWAILRKECRSEWRTRYGVNASLLFAVTSLSVTSFAVGRLADRVDLMSALLWIVLLFAALAALSHTFTREVEGGTLPFLRLVAPPLAVGTGKLLFNLLFLVVLELVAVPLFILFMGARPPDLAGFAGVLALGSLALACAATLVGAVIAQSRGHAALFAAAALPILLPVVGAAVSGTRRVWELSPAGGEIKLLVAYTAAVLAVSILLYDHLWD